MEKFLTVNVSSSFSSLPIETKTSVLTNPRKKAAYDQELADSSPFGRGLHRGNGGSQHHPAWDASGGGRRRHHQRTNSQVFVANLMRPRTFVIGFASVFGLAFATNALVGGPKEDVLAYGSGKGGRKMVRAWKNPSTGQWEQPAPWDPTYQRLRPTLELVPRDQVARRSR